jgi:hypothetical protein
MSQHLGPTYAISVLIVLLCAIAFYRGEGRALPARPVPVGTQVDVARGREPRTVRPAPGPVGPATEGSSTALPGWLPAGPPVGPKVAEAPVASGQVAARPAARPVSRAHVRPGPRGAFTRVEAGETLADFAERVYGSAGKADDVWRANRDQLPSVASLPEAGMLLRTP